jgi:hypothetical protein
MKEKDDKRENIDEKKEGRKEGSGKKIFLHILATRHVLIGNSNPKSGLAKSPSRVSTSVPM